MKVNEGAAIHCSHNVSVMLIYECLRGLEPSYTWHFLTLFGNQSFVVAGAVVCMPSCETVICLMCRLSSGWSRISSKVIDRWRVFNRIVIAVTLYLDYSKIVDWIESSYTLQRIQREQRRAKKEHYLCSYNRWCCALSAKPHAISSLVQFSSRMNLSF